MEWIHQYVPDKIFITIGDLITVHHQINVHPAEYGNKKIVHPSNNRTPCSLEKNPKKHTPQLKQTP